MATIDLSQFKKVAETTPQAGGTAPVVPSATPIPQGATSETPAPVSNASLMPKQVDLSQFKKPQKLGIVGSIYKGLAEPVLNILARPGQAIQHVTGAIQPEAGKEAPIEGEVPIGFGIKAKITDPYITAQKKGAIRAIAEDVGKGAQTIALGLGPISGGAAFGGGAALEKGAEDTTKTAGHIATDVIVQGTLGAATGYVTSKAFEFTGKAIQGGMDKLKRPFVSSFDKETAKVFQERGIEAPVSALTKSKFVRAGEAVGEGSMFGNKISKSVEGARTQIFDIAEGLKKEIDPESLVQGAASPEQVGLQLQGALDKTKKVFQNAKTQIYEDATGRISKNPAILDNTKATLQAIIDSKSASLDPTSKAQVKFYQNLLNSMRTASKRSFETVKQTRTAIGTRMKNRMDPIASGDAANLGRLYGALTDDLDATASQFDPAAGEALKAANEYFKGGMEVINSYAGRMIYRSKSPENIVKNIVKPGDVTNVKMLKGLVGDEAFRGVRTVFADDIIKSATDPLTGKMSATKLSTQLSKYGDDVLNEMLTPEGANMFKELQKSTIINDIVEKGTKEGKVLPGRFEQAYKRYGEDTLKKVLSPEEFKALNDVMTMSKSLEFGRKIAEGSQTYEKINQGLNLVLAITKWPVALAKVAGEFGITQATASKIGKKWLTEGFGPGFFETGVKAVGKAIEQAPKAVTPGVVSGFEESVGAGAKTAGKTIFRYSEKAVEEGVKVPGKVMKYHKSIPNKTGGFIKNPLAEVSAKAEVAAKPSNELSAMFNNENATDKVIASRIDTTPLERLSGGSTRNVYRVGEDKVVKVAKNPRGLE